MIFASGFPEASVGSFSLAPAEILASNFSLLSSQCHYFLYTLFEYNPKIRGRGTMLVLPDQRLS